MDNPKNYVDDEIAKTVNRNPDWYCSYCDALNSDDVHECHICGSSREDSEQNYFERRAEIEARRAEKEKLIEDASGKTDERSQMSQESRYKEAGYSASNYNSYNHEESSYRSSSSYDNKQSCDNTSNERDENSSSSRNRPSLENAFNNINWGGVFKVGTGILATIMLILLLVGIFAPKIQEVTIKDFSWERSISIEEYVTVDRDGWSLPADGRLKYSQQEIKGYTQVIDHYETKTRTYTEEVFDHYEEYISGYRDLGNGYFEEITSKRPVYRTETRTETYEEPVYRDEPIYATKYYYEIDVWQYAFSHNTSGNDQNPYWKEFTLKDLQREGNRFQTYYITVVNDEGEVDKYHFDYETWKSLNKGDVVTIKTTIFGGAELVIDGEVVQEGAGTS
jgi:hypothetical protein